LIRHRKRQKARLIDYIHDADDVCKTAQADILRVFTFFIRDEYGRKQTDPQAVSTILQIIQSRIQMEALADLEREITIDELKLALHQGKKERHQGMMESVMNFFYLRGTRQNITSCKY
jgi:hypothetical protein